MKAYNLKAETLTTPISNQSEGLVLGEIGKGRLQTIIPCPIGLKDGETVCVSNKRKNNYQISRSTEQDVGWIARISCYGEEEKYTFANIKVLDSYKDQVKVLIIANGAFGTEGDEGIWYDMLLVCQPGTILRVKPSKKEAYYLLFCPKKVKRITADEVITSYLHKFKNLHNMHL